ncbi:hypothetical protein V8E55_007284 [Tylopilus felleus]
MATRVLRQVSGDLESSERRLVGTTATKKERKRRYITCLNHFSPHWSVQDPSDINVIYTYLRSTQTSSTLTVFVLASPHVWKRAQADIDAVLETDRLPEFDDRSSLSYTSSR